MQVEDYQVVVSTFHERFRTSGPGQGSTKLPVGVKLMKEIDAELQDLLVERDGLVLAQKLFAMEITPYPELSYVRCPLCLPVPAVPAQMPTNIEAWIGPGLGLDWA